MSTKAFAAGRDPRLALTSVERAVKRALDLIASIMAIVFSLPLFLIVAVAIKLDSPGPVIFRQRRSGFNAREFIIFKFRTMTVLEDGPSSLRHVGTIVA